MIKDQLEIRDPLGQKDLEGHKEKIDQLVIKDRLDHQDHLDHRVRMGKEAIEVSRDRQVRKVQRV